MDDFRAFVRDQENPDWLRALMAKEVFSECLQEAFPRREGTDSASSQETIKRYMERPKRETAEYDQVARFVKVLADVKRSKNCKHAWPKSANLEKACEVDHEKALEERRSGLKEIKSRWRTTSSPSTVAARIHFEPRGTASRDADSLGHLWQPRQQNCDERPESDSPGDWRAAPFRATCIFGYIMVAVLLLWVSFMLAVRIRNTISRPSRRLRVFKNSDKEICKCSITPTRPSWQHHPLESKQSKSAGDVGGGEADLDAVWEMVSISRDKHLNRSEDPDGWEIISTSDQEQAKGAKDAKDGDSHVGLLCARCRYTEMVTQAEQRIKATIQDWKDEDMADQLFTIEGTS